MVERIVRRCFFTLFVVVWDAFYFYICRAKILKRGCATVGARVRLSVLHQAFASWSGQVQSYKDSIFEGHTGWGFKEIEGVESDLLSPAGMLSTWSHLHDGAPSMISSHESSFSSPYTPSSHKNVHAIDFSSRKGRLPVTEFSSRTNGASISARRLRANASLSLHERDREIIDVSGTCICRTFACCLPES